METTSKHTLHTTSSSPTTKGVLAEGVTETSSPLQVDADASHQNSQQVIETEPQYTKEGNMILPYYDHAETIEADLCNFVAPVHRAAYQALYGEEDGSGTEYSIMAELRSEFDQNEEEEKASLRFKNASSNQFPMKLYGMLLVIGDLGLDQIVAWKSHGRAFQVYDTDLFVEKILPKFFKQSKITSFQRQLNLYGFRRIIHGRDTGAYYHELFLRGKPFLCKAMFRTKIKGKPCRKKASDLVNCEPDFYSEKLSVLPRYDTRGAQERLRSFFGSDEGIQEFLMLLKHKDSKPTNASVPYNFITPHSNASLSSVGTDTSKKRSTLDLSTQSSNEHSYGSLNQNGSRKKLSIGSSMKNLTIDKAPSGAQNAVFNVTQPSNMQDGFPNNNIFLANQMGSISQIIQGLNNQMMGGANPQIIQGFNNQINNQMMIGSNTPFYIGGNYMNINSYNGNVNPLLMGIGDTTNLFMNTLNQQTMNQSLPGNIKSTSENLTTKAASLDFNPTPLQDLRENDIRANDDVIDTGDDGDLKDLLGLLNDSSH
jgi:hypothetical protein